MKSSELATLARVTVRTLRHYHQVGLLQEPPRGTNGYRDYGVHDLVRLLRIRRLADLGIPLEHMPRMLDEADTEHSPLLDQLEAGIDDEIRRLEAQKAMIREIRASDSAPDLPPLLAPFVATLTGGASDSESARSERDYAILLNHLAGEHGADRLAQAYSMLATASEISGFHEMRRLFDDLRSDASAAEIEHVVEVSLPLVQHAVVEIEPLLSAVVTLDDATVGLFESYHSDTLNPAQKETLSRLEARLTQQKLPR